MKNFFTLFLVPFLMLFTSCHEDIDLADRQQYLEGEPIEGIEFFFPLGFYSASDMTPKISPDGMSIAYNVPFANDDAQPGLYVMDFTTQEKQLLHHSGYNADWSPDSKWIAFNTYPQIYKIKTTRDSLTQLTFEGSNFSPDWSPDGKLIAFNQSIQEIEIPAGTWVMNQNGDKKTHLINITASPDWYPSGKKIISYKGISATSIETRFFVYDFETGKETILSVNQEESNQNPQVSPDGNRIVFWNTQGIWIMDADGKSSPKRIIPNHLYNSKYNGDLRLWVTSPSWHPDGEHIIYEHFKITRYDKPEPGEITPDGTLVEGYITFYKVNVDSALAISNL